MSMPSKREASLLSHDEHALILKTHRPGIYDLDKDALHATRKLLREMEEKERGFAAHKARVARGKAELRKGNFPGTAERPRERKQVFAGAVQRLNSEIARLSRLEGKAKLGAAAHRALALRKTSAVVPRPAAGAHADEGMKPTASTRTRSKVSGAKVGSVSQATKNAQARRDKKG